MGTGCYSNARDLVFVDHGTIWVDLCRLPNWRRATHPCPSPNPPALWPPEVAFRSVTDKEWTPPTLKASWRRPEAPMLIDAPCFHWRCSYSQHWGIATLGCSCAWEVLLSRMTPARTGWSPTPSWCPHGRGSLPAGYPWTPGFRTQGNIWDDLLICRFESSSDIRIKCVYACMCLYLSAYLLFHIPYLWWYHYFNI